MREARHSASLKCVPVAMCLAECVLDHVGTPHFRRRPGLSLWPATVKRYVRKLCIRCPTLLSARSVAAARAIMPFS